MTTPDLELDLAIADLIIALCLLVVNCLLKSEVLLCLMKQFVLDE